MQLPIDSCVEKLLITDESGVSKIALNTANSDLFSMGFQAINIVGEGALDFNIDRMAIFEGEQIESVIECARSGDLFLFYARKVSFEGETDWNYEDFGVKAKKPLCKDFLKPMGRIAANLLLDDFMRAFPDKNLFFNISRFKEFDSIHLRTLEQCIREEEQCGRAYRGVIPVYARNKASEQMPLRLDLEKINKILSTSIWKGISDRRAKEAIQMLRDYSNKDNLLFPPPDLKEDIEYLIEKATKYGDYTLVELLRKIRKKGVLRNWEAFFVSEPPTWLTRKMDILTGLTIGIKYMSAEFLGVKNQTGSLTIVTTSDDLEYWIAQKETACLVVQAIRKTKEKELHSSWTLTKHLLHVLTKMESEDIDGTNYVHKIDLALGDTKYTFEEQKKIARRVFKKASEYSQLRILTKKVP